MKELKSNADISLDSAGGAASPINQRIWSFRLTEHSESGMRKTIQIVLVIALIGISSALLLRGFSDEERPKNTVSAVSPNSEPTNTDKQVSPVANSSAPVKPEVRKSTEIEVPKFDPLGLYRKYRAAAESGNIEAAFVLVSALQQCRTSVTSEQEFLERVVHPGSFENVVARARQNFETCQPLFEEVGDIQDEYDRWYSVIRESGDPLFLIRQHELSYEKIKELVIAVTSRKYPEEHLYAETFMSAARLYIEFPEYGIDETRYLAWQLLACDVSVVCNPRDYVKLIEAQLPQSQAAEIYSTRDTLADAVRRQAPSELF